MDHFLIRKNRRVTTGFLSSLSALRICGQAELSFDCPATPKTCRKLRCPPHFPIEMILL